jgi:hypothetical protein
MRKDLLRMAVRELAPLWVPGLLLALLVGLFIAFFEFHAPVLDSLNRRTFTAEAWKEADSLGRFDLAWDLLDGRLVGLSRSEVEQLLGEPSEGLPTSPEWTYNIGWDKYNHFADLDSTADLVVEFKNDRVMRVSRRVR